MYNCIFSAHCTEFTCDNSCPALAETSYLLERNNISMKNKVFDASPDEVSRCNHLLDKANNQLKVLEAVGNTSDQADLLTYCAICRNWKGSRLHCTVYHLKLSKYIEDTKQSWSMSVDNESLEYSRIWSESARVLIVSGLDYVNFKDFESQTLLNIIQSRRDADKTTIIVSPKVSDLVGLGTSMFFTRLKSLLAESSFKKEAFR